MIDLLREDESKVLRRVNDDIDHADNYRRSKADAWYRYYCKYRNIHDEEFLKYRADKFSLFVPVIFSVIENLVPRFVMGTFGGYPIVNVVPVGLEDVGDSKKAETLLNVQLQRDRIEAKAIGWIKQFCMYGNSPAKTVWKEEIAKYGTRGALRSITKYVGPSFKTLDIFDLLVDPMATDEGLSSAGFVNQVIILSEDEMKERVANAALYQYNFPNDWESYGQAMNNEIYKKYDRETALKLTERQGSHRKFWRMDEYWTKDCIIVVLNRSVIIRRQPNYLMDYPFIDINRNPVMGEYYGIGDVESIEQLSEEINYIRNIRLDNMDLTSNPMFLIERSAQVDQRELRAQPGKGIYTNDIQGVKQLEIKDTSESAIREEQFLRQEIQEVSGIIDMMKGMPVKGFNDTASGMAMMLEGASYRVKLGLKSIEQFGIREIGDKFMRLNYLNLPDDYVVKVTGDSQWLKIKTPEEIFGNYDFIPSGSSEFLNKETLRQSALQLYNMMARDPNVDQAGLKRLLAMSFGGRFVESILLPKGAPEVSGGEAGQAQKENEDMLNGREVPPVGNHEEHIQNHMALMNEEEFGQLNSGIQGIFGRHVEGHKRAMGNNGEPLEDPQRFGAESGKGFEESMKSAIQKPIAG